MKKLLRKLYSEPFVSIEVSGIREHLFSDIDIEGYEDITSIENIDSYSMYVSPKKDYKFIRWEIYIWCAYIGFENLSYQQQKIVCKYMASGIGAEYHNSETIWTDKQQFIYQQEFKIGMSDSRRDRDLAVSDRMAMMVFKGEASQASAEDMIKEISILRGLFLTDGLEGIGYGDSTVGLFNYLDNTETYAKHSIIGVDQQNKTFTIAGDQLSLVNAYFRVRESTGNDGKYYVSSKSFDNTNTIITVEETIPDSTIDGDIYLNGFLRRSCASEERRDIFLDIYVNGNY